MFNKSLIFKIFLILWSIFVNKIQCNETCWNNENECNIKMELFKNTEYSNGISLQTDCRLKLEVEEAKNKDENENDFQMSTTKYLLLPRLMGVQSIILDGCQTPLNVHTFGLELLPICANITRASITHFNMETLQPLNCKENPQHLLALESLNIQSNEIAFIDKDSFPPSYVHLKNVRIENNLLKLIHRDAFNSLKILENLYIINEPVLVLKFPDLFKYSSILAIHLENVQQMTSDIFKHLPETLQNLYVANTPLDNDAVFLRNSLILKNLTIKNCALRRFTLRDVHSTVKRINLSGNVMKIFTAFENNLNELNLSNNQLQWLPIEWLKNLTNLKSLVLKGNQIQELSLSNLLDAVPNGHAFDLSQNRLQSLKDYEQDIGDVQLSQVRLKCDENPWNCLWLHEFAHYHPEKFRILQYDKFISKINVNGLECVPSEKPAAITTALKVTSNISHSASVDKIVNVSTYTLMYGSPWEFKRNQRAEALIIVFMLPLGIAFLFVLLYMWIYCQKMFHLSYYQDFSCIRRSANHSTQRFDIVRQLPSSRANQIEPRKPFKGICDENEEGYEIPVNGLMSECNCLMKNNDEINKCEKAVHITYEYLPNDEPPHQIYEEIIQIGDCDDRTESLSGIGETHNIKEDNENLSFK